MHTLLLQKMYSYICTRIYVFFIWYFVASESVKKSLLSKNEISKYTHTYVHTYLLEIRIWNKEQKKM